MISATVDYSSVLAGARKLQSGIKLGTKVAFKALTTEGTLAVIKHLQESYKTSPGRPPWTRSGTLERAVFTAISLGVISSHGVMAGIGDKRQLDSMAPYWEDVERGTQEYVGQTFSGYFVDVSGKPFTSDYRTGAAGAPHAQYYPEHKWVPAPAFEMIIKRPIKAHNFYKRGAQDIRSKFLPTIMSYIRGALV